MKMKAEIGNDETDVNKNFPLPFPFFSMPFSLSSVLFRFHLSAFIVLVERAT
jgi:hypothetical protein